MPEPCLMCGHCTERAALAERVRALRAEAVPSPDPLLSTIHLQEMRHWRQPAWLAAAQDDPIAPLVVMCRTWTDAAHGEQGEPPHDLLPVPMRDRVQAWRARTDLPTMAAGPAALQDALTELDAYLGGWLHLPDRPGARWDDAMLHERLPYVSRALDTLVLYAPDDERLTLLALSSPDTTSPFSAIDLWLQRRALRALASRHGIAFVTGLLPHLRSGAVLALVLHGDLDTAALRMLRDALRQRPDNGDESACDLRTALELMLDAPDGVTP